MTITAPTTFEQAEVNLVASLPGYESRPQQQALAQAVEQSIASKTHLLAEAGTGTGKSLGYLIPAVLSGKRVVVSTATRALQDQVAHKDLPFLVEHLGKPFTFALLKGRSNYLCGNKAEAADPADVPSLSRILARIAQGDPAFHGERDQLGFEVTDREWMQVAADSDDCQAFDCHTGIGSCYGREARDRASRAQVIVVNHALYLTDLSLYGAMIGPHDVVIFDEAHEVEDYAGNVFGATFKEGGVRGLVTELRNFGRRTVPDHETEFDTAGAEALTAMAALWEVLEPGTLRQKALLDNADEFVNFANSLIGLVEVLTTKGLMDNAQGDIEQARKKKERLYRRAKNTADRFYQVVGASFDEVVRWVEQEPKGKVLKYAPIDVSSIMRERLFSGETAHPVTAVLASATLSVNGKFDYIARRLGIDTFDSLDVGTPFDYQAQSVLYIPTSLPDPSRDRAAWSNMATLEMMELVKASQGRALILFTSVTEMRQAYETLSARLPYRCMMQGQKANKVLAEEFKADTSSVLFATKSFMTGVDFQGETCSLVIVNKMPFPVPTEPLTEARCEAIKRRGGSDFSEYTIPVMTLVLKQAFGRLIRHRNDRGVVAILDPRLQTKGYGKGIVRSLPDSPVVTDFAEVERYFATEGVTA